MKKKYVLKNKTRFMVVVFSSLLITFSFLLSTVALGFKEPTFETVSIKEGNTLWDLAVKYKKSGDIRKYIHDIKKINNMTTDLIYVGDELKIPQ